MKLLVSVPALHCCPLSVASHQLNTLKHPEIPFTGSQALLPNIALKGNVTLGQHAWMNYV